MTTVINLATGDTMEYSLPPVEAVNAATPVPCTWLKNTGRAPGVD